MLVLSRKKGESIIISDDIEIVVVSTEGDTVKVGIRAPKHVQIFRKEIYAAVKESNSEAASSPQKLLDFGALFPKGDIVE